MTSSRRTISLFLYSFFVSPSFFFVIPRWMCKIFFLTTDGRNPDSGKADFNVRWKDIAEVLQNFATYCKNEYILSTAMQYSSFIISNLGENYV